MEDTMATQHKQYGSYANAEDYQHANAYAQHAIPRYLTYSLLYMYLKKHLTGNPICENKQQQYSGRGEFKQRNIPKIKLNKLARQHFPKATATRKSYFTQNISLPEHFINAIPNY